MIHKFTQSDVSNFAIKFILICFMLFTFVSVLIAIESGVYGGDLIENYYKVDDLSLIKAFVLFVVTLLAFYVFFKHTSNLSYSLVKSLPKVYLQDNFLIHSLFLCIMIFLWLTIYNYRLGSVGTATAHSRLSELIFALLQPAYLAILYLYFYWGTTSTLFYLNASILFISLILTGFVGYLFFFLPFIFFFVLNKFGAKRFWLFFLLTIPFLPIIRYCKDTFKYGLDIWTRIGELSPEAYISYARTTVDRFSFLPNQIFVEDHQKELYYLVEKHEYLPFFQGYIGSLLHRAIYGDAVQNINATLNFYMNNSYSSNVTFPLFSYFTLSPSMGVVVFLYVSLISILLGVSFFMVKERNPFVRYLFFLISFSFLYQGWFWSFMNFLQAVWIFISINVLARVIILGVKK